jgi:hypothetical protein
MTLSTNCISRHLYRADFSLAAYDLIHVDDNCPRAVSPFSSRVVLDAEVFIGCPALINQLAPIPAIALSMRAGGKLLQLMLCTS